MALFCNQLRTSAGDVLRPGLADWLKGEAWKRAVAWLRQHDYSNLAAELLTYALISRAQAFVEGAHRSELLSEALRFTRAAGDVVEGKVKREGRSKPLLLHCFYHSRIRFAVDCGSPRLISTGEITRFRELTLALADADAKVGYAHAMSRYYLELGKLGEAEEQIGIACSTYDDLLDRSRFTFFDLLLSICIWASKTRSPEMGALRKFVLEHCTREPQRHYLEEFRQVFPDLAWIQPGHELLAARMARLAKEPALVM